MAWMHISRGFLWGGVSDIFWGGVSDIFGGKAHIPLGSMWQNGFDDMHIFVMQVRLCEANSLYWVSGSVYDKYGQKMKCSVL